MNNELPKLSPDRRPIAARHLRIMEAAAGCLVRKGASPNAISLAGMVAAVLAGIALAAAPGRPLLWLVSALLVQVRLLANLLDGMVAIGRQVASPLGELFNEVPDRVSDTAVFAGLGVAAGDPALGLVAALLALATAYLRAVGKSLVGTSDFRGPGAKQQRMAVVTATALICAVVPATWGLRVAHAALWLIVVLASVTAIGRLYRLARGLAA